MNRTAPFFLLLLLLFSLTGCSAKSATQVAKVYKETDSVKPGSYHLQFLLNGRDTLADYLLQQKARNPELKDFDVSGLMKLFRNAYPHLYLPVQPAVPLCNLETNFKHCKGIELLADFEVYGDNTIVLNRWVFYHIKLRLEETSLTFSGLQRRSATGVNLRCLAIIISALWWRPSRRQHLAFCLAEHLFFAGLTISALHSGGEPSGKS